MITKGHEFRPVLLSAVAWASRAQSRYVLSSVRNGWALHQAVDMVTGEKRDTYTITHAATGIAMAGGLSLVDAYTMWRDLAAVIPNQPARHGLKEKDGHPLWVEYLKKVRDHEMFPGRCPRIPLLRPVGD